MTPTRDVIEGHGGRIRRGGRTVCLHRYAYDEIVGVWRYRECSRCGQRCADLAYRNLMGPVDMRWLIGESTEPPGALRVLNVPEPTGLAAAYDSRYDPPDYSRLDSDRMGRPLTRSHPGERTTMTDTTASPTIAHLEERVRTLDEAIENGRAELASAEKWVVIHSEGIASCEAARADALAAIETLRAARST